MMLRRLLLGLLLLCSGNIVRSQDPTPLFSPDEDFYVEASVSNLNPYVGEGITYTFRFFNRSSRRATETLSEFEGFWKGSSTTSSRAEIIGERQYILTTFEIVLYPLQPGDIAIEPTTVFIEGTPGTPPDRLQTFGIVVTAQQLPENPPIGFDGGVGQFDMAVTLNPDTLTAGEPAVFQMRIIGSGNLEFLQPPAPPIPDDWRIVEQPATTQQISVVTERIFEWIVIPTAEGTQTIRAMVFSFFDPQTTQYRSVASNPIIVDVLPNPNPGELLPLEDESIAAPAITIDLKTISSVNDEERGFSLLFWLLWLITPGLVAGVWYRRMRHAQHIQQQVVIRQSQALRTARARLKQAMQQRKPDSVYRGIEAAVLGYCVDRLGVSDVQILDIPAHISQHNVAATHITRLQACIDQIEIGRYAPAQDMNSTTLIKEINDVLVAIDREWKS